MSNRIDADMAETILRGDDTHPDILQSLGLEILAELKRCYEELDGYDELLDLLIENHFVETSPYETVKHLIETHQDYKDYMTSE